MHLQFWLQSKIFSKGASHIILVVRHLFIDIIQLRPANIDSFYLYVFICHGRILR